MKTENFNTLLCSEGKTDDNHCVFNASYATPRCIAFIQNRIPEYSFSNIEDILDISFDYKSRKKNKIDTKKFRETKATLAGIPKLLSYIHHFSSLNNRDFVRLKCEIIYQLFNNDKKQWTNVCESLIQNGIIERKTYKHTSKRGDFNYSIHYYKLGASFEVNNKENWSKTDTEILYKIYDNPTRISIPTQGEVTFEKAVWHDLSQSEYLHFITEYHDKSTGSKHGLFFNKFNSMPKQARRSALIDGEKTAEIDIAACGPTIIYKLITDENEKVEYRQMIENGVYKTFCDYYSYKNDKQITISKSKELFRYFPFAQKKNIASAKHVESFFSEMFPILSKTLQNMVENDSESITHLLQSTQSEIMKKLQQKFRCRTIHDGAVIISKEKVEIIDYLKKTFFEFVGIHPKVRVDWDNGVEIVKNIEIIQQKRKFTIFKNERLTIEQQNVQYDELMEGLHTEENSLLFYR